MNKQKPYWVYLILLMIPVTIHFWISFKNSESKSFYLRQSKKEPYGIRYNSTRESLGIPIMPSDWYTTNTSKKPGIYYQFQWTADHFWFNQIWHPKDDQDDDIQGHFEKEIRRDDEGLIYELDRYRKILSDSLENILELKYRYRTLEKRECILVENLSSKRDYQVQSIEISCKKADSLISTWF